MRCTTFAIIVLLLLPVTGWPQDPSTSDAAVTGTTGAASGASVDADGAPISATLRQSPSPDDPINAGEAVEVTLELEHPANSTVRFPESFEPARWTLLDTLRVPTAGGERPSGSTWLLRFGIYRPGSTTLSPFPVTVTNAAGDSVELMTEPVDAKVLSALANAEEPLDFRPARPPVAVWVDDYTLVWVGGGLTLLALFGLLGLWAERRRSMIPPPPPPPRKPHEVALEKLSALAADDLVERGEYMDFWVRLSEATREYLGRTYGFPPTELTTTEVLDNLLDVVWPAGLSLTDVRRFLRRCDEVKFGGARPGAEESSEFLRRAFSIVELTRPRVEEAEDEGKEATNPADAVTAQAETPEQSDDDIDARWRPSEPHMEEE